MGPLVLASVLKQEEVPVEIVDLELAFRKQASLRWEHESATRYILQTLERTGANVFGISSICSNFPFVLALSNLIRKHFPESKIILGGPPPSSVPSRSLELFDSVDMVVIGEGERTLLELVRSDWRPESLKAIKGIAYRHGKTITMNPGRELIADLDELPMPDFTL